MAISPHVMSAPSFFMMRRNGRLPMVVNGAMYTCSASGAHTAGVGARRTRKTRTRISPPHTHTPKHTHACAAGAGHGRSLALPRHPAHLSLHVQGPLLAALARQHHRPHTRSGVSAGALAGASSGRTNRSLDGAGAAVATRARPRHRGNGDGSLPRARPCVGRAGIATPSSGSVLQGVLSLRSRLHLGVCNAVAVAVAAATLAVTLAVAVAISGCGGVAVAASVALVRGWATATASAAPPTAAAAAPPAPSVLHWRLERKLLSPEGMQQFLAGVVPSTWSRGGLRGGVRALVGGRRATACSQVHTNSRHRHRTGKAQRHIGTQHTQTRGFTAQPHSSSPA
jgi:hypothetical protein